VLTAVEGIYKDGKVELSERPEGLAVARVIVTFLPLVTPRRPPEEARNRLEQLKQVQAAEATAGSWSDEGREDPSREIEKSRHGWENRQCWI
jgi:hypothetical protein